MEQANPLRFQVIFFATILALGWILIFLTKAPVDTYKLANGRQLFAMYVPLPISIFYVAVLTRKGMSHYWSGMLLFIMLLLPFYNIMPALFEYRSNEDGYRYSKLAEYVYANKTLWGSDDLLFHKQEKVYIIQPGYRYYLALWLHIFKHQVRLLQFINMAVYLGAISLMLHFTWKLNFNSFFKNGFLAFIVLSAPYAVKNIMLGLSEWFTVTFMALFLCAYIARRMYIAVLLLALVPFFRQNLLIVAGLLFLYVIYRHRQWLLLTVCFLLFLLLPMYHNLYYAGEWKFFSSYSTGHGRLMFSFVDLPQKVLYQLSLYLGVDWAGKNAWGNIISIIFIPLGTFLYGYCCYLLKARKRIVFLVITLSAIVPGLMLGWAYYPRFEWVNLFIALATYSVLNIKNEKAGLPTFSS